MNHRRITVRTWHAGMWGLLPLAFLGQLCGALGVGSLGRRRIISSFGSIANRELQRFLRQAGAARSFIVSAP